MFDQKFFLNRKNDYFTPIYLPFQGIVNRKLESLANIFGYSGLKLNVVKLRDWFIIHVKFSGRYPMVARVLSPWPYWFDSICKQLK